MKRKTFDFYEPLTVPPTRPAVTFGVSVRVEMSDFDGWRPDQLSAFWHGVAQIVIEGRDQPNPR
jgi:hypothetical protein